MKKNVLDSIEIILDNTNTKPPQKVFLIDCLNRVTFEDIISKSDYPSSNRTAMDGYAIVHKNIDKSLKEVFDVSEFDENSALRLNTGNDIPPLADCVVEVELANKTNNSISIAKNVELYRNFVFAGSEIKKGEIVVTKGELIDEKKRALLAYLGETLINVYQKPIIGVITTGDEIVMPGEHIANKNLVYNTNYFYLDGFIKKLNAECIYFGHVKDDLDELVKTYKYAMSRCDVLISTGGSSKGTKDFTKNVLNTLGVEIKFDETTIKPGKPLIFGIMNDKLIFGMPGWPSSLVVNCQVFLKPALKKLSGLLEYRNKIYYATATKSMHSRIGKDYFNRAILAYDRNLSIEPLDSQETSNFFSMTKANCLVWLDNSVSDVAKGSLLPLIMID